ncbi:MAG: glycine reductase, partial [Alphaproteobacteria bacterium]
QRPGAPMNPAAMLGGIYSAPCADPPTLGISHLHYDRAHTDGADQGALAEAAAAGRIGSLAPRFHGLPIRYGHRLHLVQDGPELLARLREDGTDLALLPAI